MNKRALTELAEAATLKATFTADGIRVENLPRRGWCVVSSTLPTMARAAAYIKKWHEVNKYYERRQG